MHYSDRLKEVMKALVGSRSLRDFAAEAGCDHSLIHTIREQGRIPRRETLTRIADNLRLEAGQRAELFAAAGYVEFAAPRQEVAA